MCFEPARLTFFPEFFQIKAHSKQKQLCPYVPFASRQESAESKIIFEQTKGTLHLDRTAQPQENPFIRHSFVLDVVYKDRILPCYLHDRLSLLSKVDTIYFIEKPAPAENIYSIDYIFDLAFYLSNKEKYTVKQITWDQLSVPKFTNSSWALTNKERQQIFG